MGSIINEWYESRHFPHSMNILKITTLFFLPSISTVGEVILNRKIFSRNTTIPTNYTIIYKLIRAELSGLISSIEFECPKCVRDWERTCSVQNHILSISHRIAPETFLTKPTSDLEKKQSFPALWTSTMAPMSRFGFEYSDLEHQCRPASSPIHSLWKFSETSSLNRSPLPLCTHTTRRKRDILRFTWARDSRATICWNSTANTFNEHQRTIFQNRNSSTANQMHIWRTFLSRLT